MVDMSAQADWETSKKLLSELDEIESQLAVVRRCVLEQEVTAYEFHIYFRLYGPDGEEL